jgi:NAD(P)H-flavin reductase
MPDLPAAFRVADTRRETHDTWTLRIEPTGARPATFAPGQFAMIYAFGVGEAPISASDIGPDGTLSHTVRAVGGVTTAICALQPGDTLGLRGPFGTAWPLPEAHGGDVVLVAGGIGLAPLRPVVCALLADRDRYGAVSILYGGRSPADLLYLAELERWRASLAVDVTVDTADATWHGPVGVVTRLIARAAFDPARTVAMTCGPEVMMRFVADALRDRGVRDDRIWLSLERSMTCGTGHCGHCQLGPLFICKDGPVLRADVAQPLIRIPEL